MSGDYIEAFEKTRLAGIIAARALDEVAKIAKPGVTTDTLDTYQSFSLDTCSRHSQQILSIDTYFRHFRYALTLEILH